MTNAGESNAQASWLSFEPEFLKFTDQVQIKAEAHSTEVNSKHECPESEPVNAH
jgi:hypothetical protein